MLAHPLTSRWFAGAVLTGGQSRRMGADKALIEVDGVAMALRVARAMRDAGAVDVVAVGGDAPRLARLDLRTVPDVVPGTGPLGGIISALRAATQPVVVVSACDMPWLQAEHVTPLVDAVRAGAAVAVSSADGRLQPLHTAWSVRARSALEVAYADGERSPTRALAALDSTVVELGAGRWARDLDRPIDLAEAT